MQQLVAFLKTLTGPARFCALVAVAGLLLSVYAWLPFATSSTRLMIGAVLAAMAAGLVAFMSLGGHHLIAWEHRARAQPKVCLPRVYWVMLAWAVAYFVALFLGSSIYYPHGVDLGPIPNLRIASAGALVFGVSALGFTQWAGLRVRALQSAP